MRLSILRTRGGPAVWITAGLVLPLAAAWLTLGPLTAWLVAAGDPRPADLLVVLAGGSGERLATGLALYKAGLSPRILVTDEGGYPDRAMRWLSDEGVPERSVVPPLMPSQSTYEDALAVRQVVLRENIRSILVVTSPYHCRRTRLIFDRVLGGLGIQITVTASVTLYMDMAHWWQSRQGWITVPGEFPKLIWAWATVSDVGDVGAAPPPK